MFKRSFILVTLISVLVFLSAFSAQLWMTKDLPSSFDSGLTIEKAFKTSTVPPLVEFYSDTCGTCKRITPVIHDLKEGPYKDRLTLVMMNVEEPANQDIARLFGVDSLPGVFVFNHKKMKKHQITPESFVTKETLQQAIDQGLEKTKNRV